MAQQNKTKTCAWFLCLRWWLLSGSQGRPACISLAFCTVTAHATRYKSRVTPAECASKVLVGYLPNSWLHVAFPERVPCSGFQHRKHWETRCRGSPYKVEAIHQTSPCPGSWASLASGSRPDVPRLRYSGADLLEFPLSGGWEALEGTRMERERQDQFWHWIHPWKSVFSE
ncbi:hypothetical protein BKA60DRAFT_150184 [Fusarium oxysporum]|nr:hypothetical protein BKA60DRAFT_150184 [Fusarium oxysporum]